eukprot:RCo021897
MGNHEYSVFNGSSNKNATLFRQKFPYPYVDPASFYWSFSYGPDVLIFIIDQYHHFKAGTQQLVWLEQGLSQSKAKWKFLVFHAPGYSCGNHHDPTDRKYEKQMVRVRTVLGPLITKYNVQVTFG